MNILEDLQNYVADRLNADPQLSACPFLVENRRDVDFQIKQALGKQGIVGLVMTPKATFAGAYMDYGLAWQVDQLEVDVVENAPVNRGKKDGYVTGQDAAMRLFDVLCPLTGDSEGEFIPVSYEEGEDNSLLVNRAVLKCLVHRVHVPAKTVATFADGTSRAYDVKGTMEIDWLGPGVYPGNVVGVRIGEEVTRLGERSFTGFGGLSSIVVPKNVTSVGGEAFSYTGLRDAVIERGVTELGYGVFSYSNSLSSVELPDTLTKIGADVFEECYGLSSISVPKSVVDISQVAFRYSRLSAVTMEGRTKAEAKAMPGYGWNLPLGCVIHCVDGDIVYGATTAVYQNGDVVDYDIRGELARGQISGLTSLASLDIGHGVTGLSVNALYSCVNLSSVTIPNSVTGVGGSAFRNCSRLSAASLPDSVTSAGDSVFLGCSRLLDASLGDGLSAVPNGMFQDCTSLSSVVLPRNAASVGDGAFYNCTALRSVDIPDSVSSLDNSAFQNCYALADVRMPSGLVEIREYALARCRSLSSAVIPEGVRHIGADAFYGCSAVADVYCWPDPAGLTWDEADKDDFRRDGSTVCHVRSEYLGGYVTKFGGSVNVKFVGGDETVVQYRSGLTRSLGIEGQLAYNSIPSVVYAKEVAVGNSVTSIGEGAFEQCHDLTSMTIPGSVKTIGDAAFLGCVALSGLVICEGVETIEDSAFTNCKVLNNITIPSSVQNIGEDAFFSCEALYSITFSGKDRATVQGMDDYPWRLQTGCVVHCSDGSFVV